MSSIGPVVSEEKMFENVDGRRTDGRRTTDAGVTGILLAHQWAFGSGELKSLALTQKPPTDIFSEARDIDTGLGLHLHVLVKNVK